MSLAVPCKGLTLHFRRSSKLCVAIADYSLPATNPRSELPLRLSLYQTPFLSSCYLLDADVKNGHDACVFARHPF